MTPDFNFVIEKNVPLPRKSDQFPIEQLDKGDSFLVPFTSDAPTKSQIEALRQQIYEAIARAKNFWNEQGTFASFTTRVVDGGIRIWRKI